MEEDVKIFGGLKKTTDADRQVLDEYTRESGKGHIESARKLGVRIAEMLIDKYDEFSPAATDMADADMTLQKGVLLSFAATVAMEKCCDTSVVLQVAKNGFQKVLAEKKPELYSEIRSGSGFSFYYLAYRRGSEVERRIGQTFAMLCSHDGDPVYQELGEAVYCWFMALISETVDGMGL